MDWLVSVKLVKKGTLKTVSFLENNMPFVLIGGALVVLFLFCAYWAVRSMIDMNDFWNNKTEYYLSDIKAEPGGRFHQGKASTYEIGLSGIDSKTKKRIKFIYEPDSREISTIKDIIDDRQPKGTFLYSIQQEEFAKIFVDRLNEKVDKKCIVLESGQHSRDFPTNHCHSEEYHWSVKKAKNVISVPCGTPQ